MRKVGEKPAVLTHHIQLHGQATQVLRSAMIGEDKINVAFGEGPIKGEFLSGLLSKSAPTSSRDGLV